MLHVIFSGAGAATALLAAVFWVVSARVEVAAPINTHGLGALMDGYLIAKNSKGDRIDLPATLQKQSVWNARAAMAAAISAAIAALALLPVISN